MIGSIMSENQNEFLQVYSHKARDAIKFLMGAKITILLKGCME